jgi:hypothetical protein
LPLAVFAIAGAGFLPCYDEKASRTITNWWRMPFPIDQLFTGNRFGILTIVEENYRKTRSGLLVVRVERQIKCFDVVEPT